MRAPTPLVPLPSMQKLRRELPAVLGCVCVFVCSCVMLCVGCPVCWGLFVLVQVTTMAWYRVVFSIVFYVPAWFRWESLWFAHE